MLAACAICRAGVGAGAVRRRPLGVNFPGSVTPDTWQALAQQDAGPLQTPRNNDGNRTNHRNGANAHHRKLEPQPCLRLSASVASYGAGWQSVRVPWWAQQDGGPGQDAGGRAMEGLMQASRVLGLVGQP